MIRSFGENLARTLALTIFLFLLFSCGVKIAPNAPVRADKPVAPKLDCSPKDPTCDKTDPAYQLRGR